MVWVSGQETPPRRGCHGSENPSRRFLVRYEIDTTQILPASRMVSSITGFPVQPNKAIVGANAFAHEAGIHQDGVLKQRDTYEIMRAEDVGWSANQIVLGKHSGRTAFRDRMAALNIEFESEAELNQPLADFKELADKKHEIFDDDLQVLAWRRRRAGRARGHSIYRAENDL